MTIFENDLNTSNIAVDSNSNFQNICMIFIVQQLIYKNKIDLVYGGTHSANQAVGETHSSKLKCIQYMGIDPGHGRTHSVNQELTQHITLLTKKLTNYMAEPPRPGSFSGRQSVLPRPKTIFGRQSVFHYVPG